MPALAQAASESQPGTLTEDIARIKAELAEIKKELQLLRQFLVQRLAQPTQSAPTVATVRLAGNPMLGKPDAPLTLIEFSDYQCPFCRRYFQTTLPALKTEYIDTGKVRYVFRDFPLDRIHPQARKAAEAAHCAGDQGKYWEMHDLLFQDQQALDLDQLKKYARDLQLDPTAFDTCLEQGKYTAEVQQDYDEGVAAGVRGTPGFFLGKTGADDTIRGTLITGAQPLSVFRQAIEGLLRDSQ
jgi:protein-disulfide isomerase